MEGILSTSHLEAGWLFVTSGSNHSISKEFIQSKILEFFILYLHFLFFFFFQGHNLKFLSECDDALVYTVEEIITAHSYLNYNGNLKTSI